MRILLFGGTTEGRVLAHELTRQGHEVLVSVATEVGAEELTETPNARVRVGRLDTHGMAELLTGFDLCVDATHPYAQKASDHIQKACARAGIPLRRVSRERGDLTGCMVVPSAREAARRLTNTEGPVLLTTGTKELQSFAELDPTRLVVRVLPTHEALDACERLGIPHRNIIAMWGPFGTELNEAIMRHYGIRWLVTKDGGQAGGIAQKLEAAHNCGVRIIAIARPTEPPADDLSTAKTSAEELLLSLSQPSQ